MLHATHDIQGSISLYFVVLLMIEVDSARGRRKVEGGCAEAAQSPEAFLQQNKCSQLMNSSNII